MVSRVLALIDFKNILSDRSSRENFYIKEKETLSFSIY